MLRDEVQNSTEHPAPVFTTTWLSAERHSPINPAAPFDDCEAPAACSFVFITSSGQVTTEDTSPADAPARSDSLPLNQTVSPLGSRSVRVMRIQPRGGPEEGWEDAGAEAGTPASEETRGGVGAGGLSGRGEAHASVEDGVEAG